MARSALKPPPDFLEVPPEVPALGREQAATDEPGRRYEAQDQAYEEFTNREARHSRFCGYVATAAAAGSLLLAFATGHVVVGFVLLGGLGLIAATVAGGLWVLDNVRQF